MTIRSAALTAVALFLCLAGPAAGGNVSAYICAVDNCRQYLDQGEAVAKACRDGVQAAEKRPSDPACLKLCESSFGPKGKAQKDACLAGCSMFPDTCLRDGKVAPEDPQMRRPRTERYSEPSPAPSQRNQDRYRPWYGW
jgi:hypothetical protein